MKSGAKTSEFWMVAFVALTGLGIVTGIISPEEQSAMIDVVGAGEVGAAVNTATGVSVQDLNGGLITLGSVITYIWSRTRVKSNEGGK